MSWIPHSAPSSSVALLSLLGKPQDLVWPLHPYPQTLRATDSLLCSVPRQPLFTQTPRTHPHSPKSDSLPWAMHPQFCPPALLSQLHPNPSLTGCAASGSSTCALLPCAEQMPHTCV